MRAALLIAAAAAAAWPAPSSAAAATPVLLCGLSSAYKPALTDSCDSAGGSAAVRIHAARGEVEAGAVLLDNSRAGSAAVADAGVEVRWDAGAAPAGVDTARGARFLGYVHTEASPRYAGSVAGWFADALMEWPSSGVPIAVGANLAAWVSFNVTAAAVPGVYTGSFSLTGSSGASAAALPFSLQVYGVLVPSIADSNFSTIYAFDNGAPARLYGAGSIDENATLLAYLDELARLRFPAVNIYATQPLPTWLYSVLAAQGSNVLILADISSLPFDEEVEEEGVAADGSARGAAAPGPRRGGTASASQGVTGGRRRGASGGDPCPSFSPAYIAAMVKLLQPAWDALVALGLQSRATVYGFDEIDASCEPAVRQLFAAAKSAFPGVRTLSAIDWPSVPLDLPLDAWVLQFQLVDRNVTDPWVAAGHELFVYHCIEPSGPGFLNTFNERRLIEARLLFLYDFLLDVTGHLYYDVALWLAWTPSPPFWARYETSSGVSFAAGPHAPLGTLPGGDPRLLDWDPANFIWAPRTDIWANGDGVFLYPAPVGADRVGRPVSTIRFEAQRDGVEDYLVARACVDRAAAKAVVGAVVSAPTVWSANLTLFESVRVELLTRASAA